MTGSPGKIWGRFALMAVLAALLAAGIFDVARWVRERMPAGPGPEAAVRPPFAVVEVSTRTGLSNRHSPLTPHPSLANIGPWIASLGASVSVVDFDGDGWMDVFLTNTAVGSRNRLFRNNRDGTFTDVAARAGLADGNREAGSMRGLFFDADNDGYKDLLLTTTWCARFYRNNGDGTFTERTRESGIRHCGLAQASNAVDYDNDGLLDVVVADYFKAVDFLHPADYEFMHTSERLSRNGGAVSVFHNEGGGRFREVPGALGMAGSRWTLVVGVYSFRQVGRPDIHLAADYEPEGLFFNEGGGRFVNAGFELADNDGMNNMSSEIADPFNRGTPSIFVTNTYIPPRKVSGNVLWEYRDGRFRDIAPQTGVDRCGWAWGARFLDLDNDGRLDLMVSNGYISADPHKEYFSQNRDFDSLPRGRSDSRNWPAMGDASMFGYQRDCLFYNTGERFTDVAGSTPLKDDLLDGRGVASLDYRNDGRQSFIVVHQKGPLSFFDVTPPAENRWIGFKLRGTRSNRDGFGAQVQLRLKDGRMRTRELQPANGFASQSDDRLHFGLGPGGAVEEAVVRWPSGAVQRIPAPAAGRYHPVTEPG